MKSKKTFLATICIFAIAAMLMLSLTACVTGIQDAIGKKNQAKKVYSFSAMTCAAMMSTAFPTNQQSVEQEQAATKTLVSESEAYAQSETQKPDDAPSDIERINECIKMFEGYLVDNGVNETVSVPTDADGEYASYSVKTTMDVRGLNGQVDKYVMYYTEFDQSTNIKLDADIDDKDDDDDKDEMETEISTRLSGVMLLNSTVYPIEGIKEVETEGKETEVSITFTTRLAEGDLDNYIEVKQETEKGEMEYEYSVYRDGKLATRTEIEIEKDEDKDGEEEVELVFIDKTGVPSKTVYKFEREVKNGATAIVIKYNVTGKPAGVIRVTVGEDGKYQYHYHNGFVETID